MPWFREIAANLEHRREQRQFRRDRFEGKSDLIVWIYGITRNILNNRLRRGGGVRLVSLEDVPPDAAPLDLGPDSLVQARQTLTRVRQAIENLPGDQRRILELRHGRRLSIRKIAQLTTRSEDAVKSSLYRARRSLASQLPEERIEVEAAVDAYNDAIDRVAREHGIPLVDTRALFRELEAGVVVGGVRLDLRFLFGGLVGLDGVNPTPRTATCTSPTRSSTRSTASGMPASSASRSAGTSVLRGVNGRADRRKKPGDSRQ